MDTIDIYVYECPHGHKEHLSSDSVAPPEAHIEGEELVYCGDCGEDQVMAFKGLDGVQDGQFVLADTDEGRFRYCPLCEGKCSKKGASYGDIN